MGKTFFTEWELWQQMTFVLACGIVLTIVAGLFKLKYDQRMMRKYSKVEKGKQAQTAEMLEAQHVEEKHEIPFGIRALESGVEVDGVWISRSNTPVDSSFSSITDMKLSRSYNNPHQDYPHVFHGSSVNSSRAPSSFDIPISADRAMTNDSRSSSPICCGRHIDARGQPHSDNCAKCVHTARNHIALQATEGHSPISATSSARREPFADPTSSSSRSGINSGKSSRRTSDESDFIAMNEGRPYEPAYINTKSAPTSPIDPRTDLDLLQSHRMSHVAETGQLTPRVRRPGCGAEWPSFVDSVRSPQEVSTANGVDYFVPLPKNPSPPLPTAGHLDNMLEPSASKSIQREHPANHKQAVSLQETYATRPSYLPETYQPRGPHNLHFERSYEEVPIEVLTEQNQRDNQVLRKVNSGFEILRPGTLPTSSPEEDTAKRQPNRLHKKRRTSSGSRTSHFVEQV